MALFADTLTREGLVQHIFGESSRAADGVLSYADSVDSCAVADVEPLARGVVEVAEQPLSEVGHVVTSLGESSLFELVVVITLILYIIWVVRFIVHKQNGDYSKERWAFGDSGLRDREKIAIVPSDVVITLGLLLGLYTILLTMWVDWVSDSRFEQVSMLSDAVWQFVDFVRDEGLELIIVGLSIYILLSFIWFVLVYFIVRISVVSKPWIRGMIRIKAHMTLIMMLFLMPVALVFALDRDNDILFYIAVIESVILLVVYFVRSFSLFVAQKISILQWFLYLCTVEIFPVTIAWVIFERSVSII